MFEVALKCMYAEPIDELVTENNAFALLGMSISLYTPEPRTVVLGYLRGTMDPSNAGDRLHHATMLGDDDLLGLAIETMCADLENVSVAGWLSLSPAMVHRVAGLPEIAVKSEFTLLAAVCLYVEAAQQGLTELGDWLTVE